jgi:hypothetical protein
MTNRLKARLDRIERRARPGRVIVFSPPANASEADYERCKLEAAEPEGIGPNDVCVVVNRFFADEE